MSSELNNNDEIIDVEGLLSGLYRVCIKVLYKLSYPVRLLFLKPVRLGAFLLAGLAAAWLLKSSLPGVYESSFILRPSNTGDLTAVSMLWDIRRLVERNETTVLAAALRLSEEDVISIRRISTETVWRNQYPDGKFKKDTINVLIVTIRSTKPDLFDTLQFRIMNYLEDAPHYTLIRNLRAENNLAMKEKLNREINELDSLKHIMAQGMMPRNAGGLVYGEPLDPVKVYEAAATVYKQRLGLNWESSYLNNFELLKGCTSTLKPTHPRMVILLLWCIGAALLICGIMNLRHRMEV